MSQSFLNSNLNGGSTTNHSNMARGFQPGPAAQVGRYGLRTNAQVERRTTPYYYHELLLQKNLFDSSLNLLPQQQGQQLDQAKSKNSNLQLEQQQQQHQHLADASNTGKRAPMAKPQQRFISNGQGRTNYSSSSGSLSNLLGNGNGLSNGHESSDGTLADEGSFSLAFNNLPIKLPVSIIQVALTIIIVVLLVAAATTTTTTTTTATLIIITIIAMLIMLIPTTMLAKLTNALHENRC
nr:myb-like protein P [Drosophila suzukii]